MKKLKDLTFDDLSKLTDEYFERNLRKTEKELFETDFFNKLNNLKKINENKKQK